MTQSLTLCILTDSNGYPLTDANGDYLTDPDCVNTYADQVADSIDRNGGFILQGETHDERLQRMYGILFGTTVVLTWDQINLLRLRQAVTGFFWNPARGFF